MPTGLTPPRISTRITVTLSDETTLSVDRTSVEIRPDMCVWRGLVERTSEPVTLMWWPDGRMAGTVQHSGRIYSIRHLGDGELQAVVEMAENRMPPEHAPLVPRPRSDDPTLRDDPLVQQGDASTARPPRPGAKSLTERGVTPAPGSASKDDAKDVIIDVMVAYTRKAASNYTDIKHDLIDLAIEEANEFLPLEQSRPREAAPRVRLRDKLRRGGRSFRPCLALR